MRKFFWLLSSIIALSCLGWGQGACIPGQALTSRQGFSNLAAVVPGATVTVSPGPLYTDQTITTILPTSPTVTADANGNYTLCAAASTQTVTVTGPNMQTLVFKLTFSPLGNVTLGSSNIFTAPQTFNSSVQVNGNLNSAGSTTVKTLNNIQFADQWCATPGTLDQSCITNAVNALPTCSAQDGTWNHCGTVIVGNGTYSLASAVAVTSPFVSIRGQGPVSTLLNYSGTGCAFTFTATPFNTSPGDSNPSPNISDLKIAYTGASTNVCAINYFDIIGFNAQNVTVWGFNTGGSSGIWANAVTHFNERPRINATIGNSTTDFLVTAQPTAAGYPSTTFGYGKFDLWLNTQGTQTAFSQTAGIISYSNIHILNNASGTGNVGIALATNAKWFSNLMNVHIEGTAATTGFSVDATSSVQGIGSVERGANVTDNITAGGLYAVLSTEGTPDTGSSFYASMQQYPPTSKIGFQFGATSDCTGAATLLFCEPAAVGTFPLAFYKAGALLFSLSNAGTATFAEGTASGALAGFDVCQGDSIAHALKCSYNNAAFLLMPQIITTAFTTTAATTDNVTVTGMTTTGHCALTATNSGAAGGIASVFISAKAANQITVTHTATAGWTFDVMCFPQ